jgi:glycosidase
MWINPVIENNQDYESYHGYAATDLYKIDPRFGDNELYKSLVKDCHSKQIKVIWDVVYNHWGNKNWLFQNLPDSNWVHWFKDFTRTNYRAEVLLDPYASDSDKNRMTNAWFDKHMPDLNQQDEHLAKYLIQNSIWWIEYAGIDAFRIDTYAYPDQQFMKHLNESIRKEYPDFVLFGETWVQGTPVQAWYTENCYLKKNYSSSLQGVTDFQLYYAITKGLNEKTGWEEGFSRIELTLSHDILYGDPTHLVTFLDNHDLSRYYSVIGEDFNKYKMGIALMYTLRGIPSIYYGTEILMKNFADPDAKVREDFVGGWKDDTMNKFNSSGRNAQENAAFEFCSALGNWRRMNKWIATAKLKQFVPEHNTYVYFRYDDSHMLMCIYNDSENEKEVEMGRYAECLKNKSSATNILTQQKELLNQNIKIPAKGFKLLMLE